MFQNILGKFPSMCPYTHYKILSTYRYTLSNYFGKLPSIQNIRRTSLCNYSRNELYTSQCSLCSSYILSNTGFGKAQSTQPHNRSC